MAIFWDRVHEVPVEPWHERDFDEVALRGQRELNIVISDEVLRACKAASFSSIGVFQELLKQTCVAATISETQEVLKNVEDIRTFEAAKTQKAYGGCFYQRALEWPSAIS
jgi:hypothetical protein